MLVVGAIAAVSAGLIAGSATSTQKSTNNINLTSKLENNITNVIKANTKVVENINNVVTVNENIGNITVSGCKMVTKNNIKQKTKLLSVTDEEVKTEIKNKISTEIAQELTAQATQKLSGFPMGHQEVNQNIKKLVSTINDTKNIVESNLDKTVMVGNTVIYNKNIGNITLSSPCSDAVSPRPLSCFTGVPDCYEDIVDISQEIDATLITKNILNTVNNSESLQKLNESISATTSQENSGIEGIMGNFALIIIVIVCILAIPAVLFLGGGDKIKNAIKLNK